MQLTKAGLPDCAGLSAPLLFACNKVEFSHDKAQSLSLWVGGHYLTLGGGGGGEGGAKVRKRWKDGTNRWPELHKINYTQLITHNKLHTINYTQ